MQNRVPHDIRLEASETRERWHRVVARASQPATHAMHVTHAKTISSISINASSMIRIGVVVAVILIVII